MKRLSMFLAFMLVAASLFAATISLAWDPMPAGQSWTAVRVYERSGVSGAYTYVKIAEATMPDTTIALINVSAGSHTYIVRSFDGSWESVDSNSVSTLPIPNAPTGLKYTITILVTPQ